MKPNAPMSNDCASVNVESRKAFVTLSGSRESVSRRNKSKLRGNSKRHLLRSMRGNRRSWMVNSRRLRMSMPIGRRSSPKMLKKNVSR